MEKDAEDGADPDRGAEAGAEDEAARDVGTAGVPGAVLWSSPRLWPCS